MITLYESNFELYLFVAGLEEEKSHGEESGGNSVADRAQEGSAYALYVSKRLRCDSDIAQLP